MDAFILIKVKTGSERNMYQSLIKIKGVVEVNELYGEWDIITKVTVDDVDDLDELITEKIRSLPEIQLTSTMIVAKYKVWGIKKW